MEGRNDFLFRILNKIKGILMVEWIGFLFVFVWGGGYGLVFVYIN